MRASTSAQALCGHDVSTAQEQGWRALKNGDLLARAESMGFDLFILADKNLRYQQNLAGREIGILELWTNHRPTLERYFPLIRATAEGVAPGRYVELHKP